MHTAKRISLLLDLVLLAASLANGGPVAAQVQTIAIVVAAVVGALAVFVAVVLTLAAVQSRQAPYPMQGPGGNPWSSN
jgi:hypothetical protein